MKKNLIYSIFVIIILIIIIMAIISSYNKKEEVNDDNYIIEGEESGEEYNSIHLNNFNFEVVSIGEEASNYIEDINEFIYNMKEYIYINGIVEANKAEYVTYYLEDENMMIKFKLNDEDETRVIAKINLENNTYEFITY